MLRNSSAGPVRSISQLFAWALVGSLLVTDVLWCLLRGLSVSGVWIVAGCTCILLAVSAVYRRRSRCIMDWTEGMALWIAFSAAGCVFSYLCATCAMPLHDDVLANIDRAAGFDWQLWRETLLGRPLLHSVLAAAYGSLFAQILFSVFFFPARGLTGRGRELFLLAALTLLPTASISALYPVVGPLTGAPYMPDLLALRAEGPREFELLRMQGIIQMPSYHTILAILFTYAYRGTGTIGWGIAGLNVIMLPSIPPIGGHYLADMIAGGAIAVLFILGSRWRSMRFQTAPAPVRPSTQAVQRS